MLLKIRPWYVTWSLCLNGENFKQIASTQNMPARHLPTTYTSHQKLRTWCFSSIIPERLSGNKWILGPFRGRSELWRAQSGRKIHCESISDTPEGSKWLKKLVQDRFLTHVGPQIFQDSGMINKKHWVMNRTISGRSASSGGDPAMLDECIRSRRQKWQNCCNSPSEARAITGMVSGVTKQL